MSRTSRWLAAGAGAAAMYFLDPDRGRSRRIRTTDQLRARSRRMRRRIESERRYAAGAAEGLRHDSPARRPVDDRALTDRVRSELGPVLPLDRINLDAVDGVVELRGELDDAAQIDALVDAVHGVVGVNGVTNLMHLPGTAAPTKVEARRAGR